MTCGQVGQKLERPSAGGNDAAHFLFQTLSGGRFSEALNLQYTRNGGKNFIKIMA
jgi:hypothetical protein